MSSNPVEVAPGVQSDAIGEFEGNDNLKEEGFEKEKDSVSLREILGNSERVVDGERISSSEGKLVFLNVDVNGDGERVFRESKGSVDGVSVGGGEVGPSDLEMGSNAYSVADKSVVDTGKDSGTNLVAVYGSVSQQLFPKPLNDDRLGGEVKAGGNDKLFPYTEKTLDGNVTEVSSSGRQENHAMGSETKAEISNKEANAVQASEGHFSETNIVNLVVDLGVCVRKNEKGSKKNNGFCASDIVWAKVRSHPWWPGQIFKPGDASDKASKYFRSKSYLVAYFGDQTFAWNNEENLKPFVPHFSQMIKQTSMEAFRLAVDCALDEVSRRVEFGLSCHCIADDVYNRLKVQVVENTGIWEPSRMREGGDRYLTVSSFEPVKFLDYVKSLALDPRVEVNRLEHVTARGQMLAFYRWKGCYHLAEFGPLVGHLNNEAVAPNPITGEKEEICEMSDDETLSSRGTLKEHSSRPQKRKNISGDSGHSTKKVKRLSDLMAKRGSKKEAKGRKTEGIAVSVSLSPRGMVAKLLHNGSKTEDCSPQYQGITGMASRELKPSFGVGESILRVVGQLSQPSPLLKLDVSSHGKTTKAKGGSKQSRRRTQVVPAEYSSNELLSELHHTAMEPLKDNTFLSSMVGLLSDFRNSVVQKHEELVGNDAVDMSEERPAESGPAETAEGCSSGSRSKEKASDSEITTISDFGDVEHSHCNDKVVSVSVQQTFFNDRDEVAAEPKPLKGDGDSTVLLEMEGTVFGSEPHTGSESVASERDQLDEKLQLEDSPTALALKFADMDSIPSESKLNKIFSQFGPLKESETEVLTKKHCARVVFKRRLDAETAFSSSGKFETFGPSLVCYRLNYAPSPRKSPSGEAKRRKKDGSPVEGNAP